MLDPPALLRPGRFDRVVMVPLPDTAARHQILKIHSAKMQLVGVPLDKLAAEAENSTGAELEAICREAGMMAVRRDAEAVTWTDFEEAMRKVKDKTQKPDIMFF